MAYSHRDESLASDRPKGQRGPSPRLLDQVRARMRRLGLAKRTEEAYVAWIRRFILANNKRHPREMGAVEVEAFLSYLAVHNNVAASTQNQALAALLFLYRQVLGIELPWMESVVRARRSQRIPVVLSRDEVTWRLAMLEGPVWLMAALPSPGPPARRCSMRFALLTTSCDSSTGRKRAWS